MWYKIVTPTGYYFSPFAESKSCLESFDNPKELSDHMNVNYTDSDYSVITNNLVEIFSKNVPDSQPVDLPAGVYTHEHGSIGSKERLLPMETREDKYIDIIDKLDELENTIQDFINNKHIYDSSCSIYKLGVLLFGPPGTGKSHFCRKLVNKYKDAIVIFLDSIPSRAFLEKLETTTKDTLKIIVVEEVVSMVEGSDDIRKMLDFLDGSRSVSNTVYLLSTNYPESIPENVIRNGRIDTFVQVAYPSKAARAKIGSLYLQREFSEEELNITVNMPIVDIREMCFFHKKTGKPFIECGRIIKEKNDMLKKHFGKTQAIKLT
jgi:hypothetical protein